MIRTEAQLPVSRFAELISLPRRTYHYRLARHRAGEPAKGPWPAPVVDRIEPVVAKYAGEWDAWGHRKIWVGRSSPPMASSSPDLRKRTIMPVPAEALPAAAATGDAQRAWRTPDERQTAARASYRSALRRGERLTGLHLASRYGMSERWGRARIAEVRAEAARDGDQVASSRRGAAPAGNAGMPSTQRDGDHRNGRGGVPAAATIGGNGTTALPTGDTQRQMPSDHDGAVRAAEVDDTADAGAAVSPADRCGLAPGPRPTAQPRVTTIAVVVVATVAAAASYDHQRALAELAGEGWRSWLLPLSVDGLLTAATMLMLTRRRSGVSAGALTRISLGLGVVASVAANVMGADPTLADPVLVGRLVAAWPPLSLFLSLELLMRQLGSIRSRGGCQARRAGQPP